MRLYVVRHAHAGNRGAWGGPDAARPLSKKGRRQAEGIAERLAGCGAARLLSSPAARCVETLGPLAERLGVPVEVDRRIEEGARGGDALALADELRRTGPDAAAVVCSHGDVIPDLLRLLRDHGVRVGDPLVWPKASTWVVSSKDDRWAVGRYLPPPET
jgi:8-oxo-dGTP diphosphatase